MSGIKPFKVYRNRRDYFFLKALLVIITIACFVCLHIYNNSSELPFFASRFTCWVTLLILGVFAIFFFIQSFSLFTTDDKTLDNKYRHQTAKKIFSIIAMYLFAIACSLYFGAIILFFAESTVEGIFSLSNNYLGNPQVQQASITAKVIPNPSFNKIINAGTTKHPRDIIDPSTYKIYAVIDMNRQSYALPVHCYTSKELLKIKSQAFQIIGRKSFAGFNCTEKCALSYQFTTTANAAIPANQFMECDALNRMQPDAPES